jgi:hypothetical protein
MRQPFQGLSRCMFPPFVAYFSLVTMFFTYIKLTYSDCATQLLVFLWYCLLYSFVYYRF